MLPFRIISFPSYLQPICSVGNRKRFQRLSRPPKLVFCRPLKRLDAWLQELIDKDIAPNAVTFVAHRCKVVHYKAFGFSNLAKKTPLKRDDLYRIASQSKAITTVTLMTLYEEEKFLLDDPISKYIPAFKKSESVG